jgi:NitT/TauT family transport system substrate-binding protein
MLSRRTFLLSMVSIPVVLAACGSDDKASDTVAPTTAATPTTAASSTTAAGAATTAAGSTATTATTAAATSTPSTAAATTTAAASGGSVTLRLGFFPNITHAPALVGVQQGLFAKALGANVKLETSTYNAGPAATEALFADAIDATFIGPNPAINAYVKSKGDALRIVAGSTSGGAFFIVKPEINSAADLKNKKVASPQLGGTQDVALRSWLKSQGLSTDTSGGGDVSIVPQDNGLTLDAFKSGDIVGGWLPEPWATRLIQEGGGKILVDERTLWPDGKFVTTHLIVAKKFLDKHPDVVKALIQGELDTLDYIKANQADAQKAANAQINAITQKPLKDEVISASWKNLEFTYDPIASSLKTSADAATAVGLLDKVDLDGIYALDILNGLLKDKGLAEVKGI